MKTFDVFLWGMLLGMGVVIGIGIVFARHIGVIGIICSMTYFGLLVCGLFHVFGFFTVISDQWKVISPFAGILRGLIHDGLHVTKGLKIGDVVGFMDISLSGGVLRGDRLMEFFRRNLADRSIEALDLPFAAVATSLRTGAEVWLRSGSTLDAVRASIALPGLFAPVRWEGSLLVDGGLVNPVPVSLARAMGADISRDYAGKNPLMIAVLKGACTFLSDLMRASDIPLGVEFMAISSYGASTDSSGVVRILKDLDINIEGRHVLIVEDIIDSGLTLSYLVRTLEAREPASLEVCALMTKPERRQIDVAVRYVGFEIPNRFVIGYGLDFAERYRNLPYVGVLNPELLPEGE